MTKISDLGSEKERFIKGYRILLAYIVILLSLLFFPYENRALLFFLPDSRAEWFGEIELRDNDETYVFSKNGTGSHVELKEARVRESIVKPFSQDASFTINTPDASRIRAQSYSLLVLEPEPGNNRVKRTMEIGGTPFSPRELLIVTNAEDNIAFVWNLAVVMLAIVLAVFLTAYYHDVKNAICLDE